MEISDIIKQESFSSDDIIKAIIEIGKNKDTIIVKNDGIREMDQYSVIIISSKNPAVSFRCDHNSLSVAMKKILNDYVAAASL